MTNITNYFDLVREANLALEKQEYNQSKRLFSFLLEHHPDRSLMVVISGVLKFIERRQIEYGLSLIDMMKPVIEYKIKKDNTVKQAMKILINRLNALDETETSKSIQKWVNSIQ